MVMRCEWPEGSKLMINYHDTEWGTPLHDDRKLFEFLVLDCFQAGLSWEIVLKKRESFRSAFDDFNPERISKYTQRKIQSLLKDPGIIRNRLKVESTVSNAGMFLEVQQEFGSFDSYIWRFTEGKTIVNSWKRLSEIPANTPVSDTMSRQLKKRGFKFVGSTICYAFMQAAGMVNDHVVDCFRYQELIETSSQ
jgi:DNA-3-methyladenine glycosylase I